MRPKMASTPGLDRERALAWLTSGQVVDNQGAVRSWVNPAHPGFAYPEAAAIWLSWACWRSERSEPGPASDVIERVAARLAEELARGRGCGRSGRAYLFDTCVALHALARALGCGLVDEIPPGALAGASTAIQRFMQAGTVVLPLADERETRWSERWGSHLVRAAALLGDAGQRLGEFTLGEMALRIRERCVEPDEPRYVHAWLYALESELTLDRASDAVVGVGERLAGLQTASGALPAWSDGSGPERADATAQAVRVWAYLDRERFGEALERARVALASLQQEDGGLAYESGSGDRNTWATAFADQAMAWAESGPEPGAWI